MGKIPVFEFSISHLHLVSCIIQPEVFVHCEHRGTTDEVHKLKKQNETDETH